MNQKEFKKYQLESTIALFKITARCNDSCQFCIEREYTEKGIADMSFRDIRNNFEYLRDNFNLDYLIITGGEPTLHSDLVKIVDYFYKQKIQFKLITNLLNFSQGNFLRKILSYFPSNKDNRIIGSINDLPINKLAVKRITGLKKLLGYKIPFSLITVIYKRNLESLPDLIIYLNKLFKKYHYEQPINLEFRLIYLGDTLKSLLKTSLPTDFQKIKQFSQQAIETANSLGITLTLWNFPFCYLEQIPQYRDKSIKERRQRKLLKVSQDFQLEKIQVRDFEECFDKPKTCLDCRYNNDCSGIEKAYLEKYNFPSLKPFK